jgi:hypothetical protein
MSRTALVLVALLAAGALWAQSSNLGGLVTLGQPDIRFTRAAGTHVRQDVAVTLQEGENRLLLDVAALETDPATVRLRVLEPAAKVRVTGSQVGQQPGQMLWRVVADGAGPARLSLSYEISSLQADVAYSVRLDPEKQQLGLVATVSLRNNGKHDLPQAKVTLAQGQQTTVALRVGETVQQRLFALSSLPYTTTYLYDNPRFKDSVHTMLTIAAEARPEMALPAGKARLFAPGEGGADTFVAEAGLPYLPAREKIELDLGVAPDLAVARNRLRSDQVNVRNDVYHKLALFDLDEDYELPLTNQRRAAVTLLVREHIPGDWQLVKSSIPAVQTDAGTLEFTVPLAAGAKDKLTYSLKRLNVEP